MRKILLFLTAISFWIGAHAQLSVGLSVGYDRNTLSTGTTYKPFYMDKGMSGFTIGIPLRYDLKDWFALQTDLSYIQKNRQVIRNFDHEGTYNKSLNSYLQIPLMAHFSFGGERLRGFVNLGGYGAYRMSGRNIPPFMMPYPWGISTR